MKKKTVVRLGKRVIPWKHFPFIIRMQNSTIIEKREVQYSWCHEFESKCVKCIYYQCQAGAHRYFIDF